MVAESIQNQDRFE